MARNLLLLFLIIFIIPYSYISAAKTNDIISELDNAINNKQTFDSEKQAKIQNIKDLYTSDISLLQQYHINEGLYKEYQKFKLDSAIKYTEKNIEIASLLNNEEWINRMKIQLAVLYSSTGKYRESENLLNSIDPGNFPNELMASYYKAYRIFFSYYGSNTNSGAYLGLVDNYRTEILKYLKPETPQYIIVKAEKDIYAHKFDEAEISLLNLYPTLEQNSADYAMVTYLLGIINRYNKNISKAMEFFALSSIADIKNSIKDNASIQMLAAICYEKGDIKRANKYATSAIEDAIFCNVQFRTIQMSEIYTIINTTYQEEEARSKNQLQSYVILISILSLFLILSIVYVYKQIKKLSDIRKQLHLTNEKLSKMNSALSETNKELSQTNIQLSESNLIKEEYIAHFFDLCSAYINKLESYRKNLNKLALEKRMDELIKVLKSTTLVENELQELYSNFDMIFINLYPTFVEDFNALLIEEEQITLKQGEILNTELRIFALIRLGIADSVKIAAFLRYSLSTIYNYRTKARNKAAVSRDDFEKMVMKIGSSTNT